MPMKSPSNTVFEKRTIFKGVKKNNYILHYRRKTHKETDLTLAKIAAIQSDFACVLIKHLFFLFEQILWNALSCLYSPNILFIQKNVLACLQLLFGYDIW